MVTSDTNLISDLARSGLDPDLLQRVAVELARGQAAIAAAAKAEADRKAEADAVLAAKRAANAERQKRFREKNNARNALRTVTNGDEALPPAPSPLPPQTPPITPNPSPTSDPIGSGSPSAEPSAPATLVELDPRRDLFGRGLQITRKMTGRAEPGCRALLGRWLALANDSAVIVITVLDQAFESELANAIPWIEKTIKAEMQRNGSGSNDLFAGRSSGGRSTRTVHDNVSAAMARHADQRGLRSRGGEDDCRSEDREDHRPRRDDPEIEDADWTPAERYYAAH